MTDMLPIEAIQFLEAREALFRQPLRERSRLATLMALRASQQRLDALAEAFAAEPDNAERIDALNLDLGQALSTAGTLLDVYRNAWECLGEA